MCAIDDAEPPRVYEEWQRTARKPHRCNECQRTIHPGEQYRASTGLWEAGWYSYKTCRHCCGLGVFMRAVCGGYPFGELHSELVEHWREGYTSILVGRWIASMRLKWHAGADAVPEGARDEARRLMAAQVAA